MNINTIFKKYSLCLSIIFHLFAMCIKMSVAISISLRSFLFITSILSVSHVSIFISSASLLFALLSSHFCHTFCIPPFGYWKENFSLHTHFLKPGLHLFFKKPRSHVKIMRHETTFILRVQKRHWPPKQT